METSQSGDKMRSIDVITITRPAPPPALPHNPAPNQYSLLVLAAAHLRAVAPQVVVGPARGVASLQIGWVSLRPFSIGFNNGSGVKLWNSSSDASEYRACSGVHDKGV